METSLTMMALALARRNFISWSFVSITPELMFFEIVDILFYLKKNSLMNCIVCLNKILIQRRLNVFSTS